MNEEADVMSLIAPEAYKYVLQAKYHHQQQNEAASQIQVLIETLYKTIESLTTENQALCEENEVLQTQVKRYRSEAEMKQKKGLKMFVLQGAKEGGDDLNLKRNFLMVKKFWGKKNERSQRDKNEKQGELSVSGMAIGSEAVKEEATGKGKQQMPRSHTKETPKRSHVSFTSDINLENGRANEKQEDFNVCDMAVECKVEEVMEGGEQDLEKDTLSRTSSYPETTDLTDDEQASTSGFQGRAETCLDLRRFWELAENEISCEVTSYQVKDNLIKVDMSIAEEKNVNPDEFTELEAEELRALTAEFEALEANVLEQQATNTSLKSDAEKKEGELEQLLREKRAELETLAARNMYLINDIDKEREMSDALNATIRDLEEQCGRLKLENSLERKKHQPKDRGSK